jgi:glycerophosphoryl diester phosphodiesterase
LDARGAAVIADPLLDPLATPVIAHRGAAAEAPENTLAAFRLALEQGAEAFELDVHATADGVPVVIHDPSLERTTDLEGFVAACPMPRLREADAGARFTTDGGRTFPWRGRGVGIPTLAEVLDEFPALPVLIEVKDPRAQAAVARVLLETGAAGRCVVASSQSEALAAFEGPPFLRGASRRDIARLWLGSLAGLSLGTPGCRAYAVPERHRGLPVVTGGFLAAARRLSRPVHVWTVNDPGVAAGLWLRGVAGIITNTPAAVLAAR